MNNFEGHPVSPNEKAVGHIVDNYILFGREHDGEGTWVGADLFVDVESVGRFFLNVITKQQYISENLKDTYAELDDPQELLSPIETVEKRPPYVLNDNRLTEGILQRKIHRRVVEEDFAASLFWAPDEELED